MATAFRRRTGQCGSGPPKLPVRLRLVGRGRPAREGSAVERLPLVGAPAVVGPAKLLETRRRQLQQAKSVSQPEKVRSSRLAALNTAAVAVARAYVHTARAAEALGLHLVAIIAAARVGADL